MRVRARSRVKRDVSLEGDWRKANVTFKRRVLHLYETNQLMDVEFHVYNNSNGTESHSDNRLDTCLSNGHTNGRARSTRSQQTTHPARELNFQHSPPGDPSADKVVVRAHRLVVAMASEELQRLLYLEDECDRQLPFIVDVECSCPPAFRDMIDFIYTGECRIDVVDKARDIFHLAKKYRLQSLLVYISKFITNAINNYRFTPRTCANLLFFLEFVLELQEPQLLDTCWSLMDRHAARIVSSDDFLRLDKTMLATLLRRESFDIGDELVKFLTIKRWADRQLQVQRASSNVTDSPVGLPRDLVSDLMPYIRLELISETDFIKSVVPSGLIGPQELVSFFMTTGISMPRSLDLYNAAAAARSLIARRPQSSVVPFERCLRFRTGFQLPREMMAVAHEVRLQVDAPVRVDGVCLGYVLSQMEMGVTVRVQGPFERVQWTDMFSQYCPVSGDVSQRGHADMRIFFRQPVRLEPGLCYKIVAKIDRWTLTGDELGLWGGQSGPCRVRTDSNVRVYFLEAAVEKGRDIPFANMDQCRGLITEILFNTC